MRLARLVRLRLTAKATVLALAVVVAVASCGTVPAAMVSESPSPQVTGTRVTSTTQPPTAAAVLDETRFWSIIATTRASRSTSQRAELLQGELKKLPPTQIAAFDRQLTRSLNSIGDPEHLGAAEIMMGFTTKETFRSFRGWIVAQGEVVHRRFREDPDSLVDAGLDREGELVAGEMVAQAPDKVYREVTGRSLSGDFPDLPTTDDLASSLSGPTYAELARSLPRLAAAYLPRPTPAGNAYADDPRGIDRN